MMSGGPGLAQDFGTAIVWFICEGLLVGLVAGLYFSFLWLHKHQVVIGLSVIIACVVSIVGGVAALAIIYLSIISGLSDIPLLHWAFANLPYVIGLEVMVIAAHFVYLLLKKRRRKGIGQTAK